VPEVENVTTEVEGMGSCQQKVHAASVLGWQEVARLVSWGKWATRRHVPEVKNVTMEVEGMGSCQ
jgi:hypothetical protein